MNNRTIIIAIVGGLILLVSVTKWFFVSPDISQLMFGSGIGVCIMAFAYIYDWMILYTKKFKALQEKVDELWFQIQSQGGIEQK